MHIHRHLHRHRNMYLWICHLVNSRFLCQGNKPIQAESRIQRQAYWESALRRAHQSHRRRSVEFCTWAKARRFYRAQARNDDVLPRRWDYDHIWSKTEALDQYSWVGCQKLRVEEWWLVSPKLSLCKCWELRGEQTGFPSLYRGGQGFQPHS